MLVEEHMQNQCKCLCPHTEMYSLHYHDYIYPAAKVNKGSGQVNIGTVKQPSIRKSTLADLPCLSIACEIAC